MRKEDVILQIVRDLARGERVTSVSVARRYEVTHRTAQRYFEQMQRRMGLPLHWDAKAKTYFLRGKIVAVPAGFISDLELTALAVASRLGLAHVLPLSLGLTPAVGKLDRLLRRETGDDSSRWGMGVGFAPAPARHVNPSVLDRLVNARTDQHTVRMTYFSASRGKTATRCFDPYWIELRGPDWYAVGRCHQDDRIKTFALSRMRDVRRDGGTLTGAGRTAILGVAEPENGIHDRREEEEQHAVHRVLPEALRHVDGHHEEWE